MMSRADYLKMQPDMDARIKCLRELQRDRSYYSNLDESAKWIVGSVKMGGKLLIAGNGGSAAESQHLAAEMMVRLRSDSPRKHPIPAIALATDGAIMTAQINDLDRHDIFARQIEALARPGDVFIGLTTSGASFNIQKAFTQAKMSGCATVLLGSTAITAHSMRSEFFEKHSNVRILIPSSDTAIVQEMHLMSLHLLCSLVDDMLGVNA